MNKRPYYYSPSEIRQALSSVFLQTICVHKHTEKMDNLLTQCYATFTNSKSCGSAVSEVSVMC